MKKKTTTTGQAATGKPRGRSQSIASIVGVSRDHFSDNNNIVEGLTKIKGSKKNNNSRNTLKRWSILGTLGIGTPAVGNNDVKNITKNDRSGSNSRPRSGSLDLGNSPGNLFTPIKSMDMVGGASNSVGGEKAQYSDKLDFLRFSSDTSTFKSEITEDTKKKDCKFISATGTISTKRKQPGGRQE